MTSRSAFARPFQSLCSVWAPARRALVLGAALAVWLGAGAASAKSIGVLPLIGADGEEVPLETLAGQVDTAVSAALKTEGYTVKPASEMRAVMAELAEANVTCLPSDMECFGKIGVYAGVDDVLVAAVSSADGSVALTLARVDQDGMLRSKASWPLPSGAEASGATVRRLAAHAVLGTMKTAAVRVTSDQPGVLVRVDGLAVGTTPLPGAIQGLTPGEHRVSGELVGYPAKEHAVRLTTGSAVDITLNVRNTHVKADTPKLPADDVDMLPMGLMIGGGTVAVLAGTTLAVAAAIGGKDNLFAYGMALPFAVSPQGEESVYNTAIPVGYTVYGILAVGLVTSAVGASMYVAGPGE